MARQIRHVALVLFAAFALVSAGTIWWQILHADALGTSASNPRPAELARTANRGRILDRNGVVLAQSVPQPDGTRVREYVDPSLGPTIGYVSTRYGLVGIEQEENAYLSGRESGDPLAGALDDLLHRQPRGGDVTLTIDERLQHAAAAALGDRPGAVVALDPRTGAVLAMVSSPGFDASTIDRTGEALLHDPRKPLLNRATQGLYPPGSVYKIVTATAALDTGIVKPTDIYRCSGSGIVIDGFVIGCENAPPGQTQWDFKTAFAYSINATFAQVAATQLGSDLFLEYSHRFGLDRPLPFDLPTAISRTSINGGALGRVLLASSGFGQGQLQVTPLQIALIGATVANGGVEPRPYLVQQVQAADGSVLFSRTPEQVRRVMKPETAATLTDFMKAAVQEFGGIAGMLGQDIAGKTGTAETGVSSAADSWFVGFMPAEHPGIVVAAIVENGGPGSQAAAPVAEAVFKAYRAGQ